MCDPESDGESKKACMVLCDGSDLRLQWVDRVDEARRRFGDGGVGRVLRFDASASHVLEELIWNFRENVLGQTGHAEDVISSAIDVVTEGNKLRRNTTEIYPLKQWSQT